METLKRYPTKNHLIIFSDVYIASKTMSKEQISSSRQCKVYDYSLQHCQDLRTLRGQFDKLTVSPQRLALTGLASSPNALAHFFFQFGHFSGTGSNPCVPHGLHRKIRHAPSIRPLIGPCFLKASIV
jgi:hypothetical protein